MKRISVALLLMLLSSTAHARGYSFSVGGHFIHVEAGGDCRSPSCTSRSGLRPPRPAPDHARAPPAPPPPPKPVAVPPACPPAAVAPAAPAAVAPPSVPAPVPP